MPRRFDDDMAHLRKRLLSMGGIAEEMIHSTMGVLTARDASLIQRVRMSEKVMDGLQREVDDETVRLITVHVPVARHLRMLLTVTRMNSEIERVGDQANVVCKIARRFLKEPLLRPLVDLPRMADIVMAMVRSALNAFAEESEDQAMAVIRRDDEVDNLYKQMFRELTTYLVEHPSDVDRVLHLVLIAKAFERIGDHAVNMAEEVIYAVRGRDVRHEHLENEHLENE